MPGLLDFCSIAHTTSTINTDTWPERRLIRFLGGSHQIYRILQGFYRKMMEVSERFYPPKSIREIARGAAAVLDLGHQTGEGCLLTGE